MYNQLVWNDDYNIGVEVIDKEHRRLFNVHPLRGPRNTQTYP